MDASQPVTCPLCGAVVRDKPAADASDIHELERHFSQDCPARSGPEPSAAAGPANAAA